MKDTVNTPGYKDPYLQQIQAEVEAGTLIIPLPSTDGDPVGTKALPLRTKEYPKENLEGNDGYAPIFFNNLIGD